MIVPDPAPVRLSFRESFLGAVGAVANGKGWKALCPAHDDQNPSLDIDEAADGRLLFVCRAGCDQDAVVAALRARGITLNGNASLNRLPSRPASAEARVHTTDEIRSWPSTRALYVYAAAAGSPVMAVLRTQDKKFRQYRSAGPDGWQAGLNDTAPIPYRLPELVRAVEAGKRIYIPEGEKDVESLRRFGFAATCNPGGAGKWRASFAKYLRGADVVVLPDHDEVGERHAEQVARSLVGVAREVRILRLPGLPPKGDVSDWLGAGGTREELERLAEEAPMWEPADESSNNGRARHKQPGDGAEAGKPAGEQSGNHRPKPAEIGAALKGEHRFLYLHGTLYVYRDGCYRPDAEALVRKRVLEILGNKATRHDAEEVVYWLAITCDVEPERVNAGDLVNVANGLLDWRTGALRSHTPDVLTTIQIPVRWVPDALCERGDLFLSEVLPDTDTRGVLEEFVGYCLLRDCRFQKALMLTGGGENGKSKFLGWVIAMLSPQNVSAVKLQDLSSNENRFRSADLVDKLANVFPDLPKAALQETADFKALVCGEEIQVERKHRDPFKLRNRAKLLFSANEFPKSRDRTKAFFRRWIIVPFPVAFPEGDPRRDPDLLEKLTTPEGLSYLLRLAVEGLRRLVSRGAFRQSKKTQEALNTYRRDCDNGRAFLEAACKLQEGAVVPKRTMYAAYKAYCEAEGVKPTCAAELGKSLKGLFGEQVAEGRRGTDGARVTAYIGIALAPDFLVSQGWEDL